MFKKKIAFKLTAGFVAIVLLSMLAIGVFFIEMFREYTIDSRKKIMLDRAHSIADVIYENTLPNGQMRGFGGFIRFLDTLSESKVWITDKEGNPAVFTGMGQGMAYGYSFGSEPLPTEAEKVIKEVLSGKESISQSFSSIYKEATLTIGVPILDNNNGVVGSILLHAPVTGITQTLDKAAGMLGISLFAALIIAVGLGIFYSILFTRPLKAMNQTAIKMAGGDYTVRTGVRRKDELGQLGSSIDLLASRLGYTINELFQEKGKINDIISSISEGIVAFDLELNPISFNNAISNIMNRPHPYESRLLADDFKMLEIHSSLSDIIKDRIPLHITKDWMNKKLKFILSPILDNKSNVTGCVALIQDISESERLEQLRKDFVANVSHEFRTPLTVIRGSLEALLDGTINKKEDITHYHGKMLSETRSLERLVGDLLELSRLQSGKILVNKEKVHIKSLISDITRSMQSIADKKHILISSNFSDDTTSIIGDYDRLRQLFIIFIDNAIKYSPDNTKVLIDISIENNLKVVIQDQGYGIPKEELPYVWDRFYKADKSRNSGGTGLGLAIAKHLVELHNGSISLQSDVGIGTTVIIELPV
ncbi:HAMP domain-containing sensor histidine kinase [Pseudobacteroides cellulosolvens]|uniref:histidine kinase n=1 Tax=Pseudobacteroides cellulosolvens ATCC 35603 = DSM 2933 TaxID=398512 RepID=A0A0L6JNH5_9FIRM|nr:ATP-binding protein [Pseudobacteroides cellulosolvens]KNY27309.1 integral membrane sensor signal transduction histidine kinase [Pseudobacteroides cellulosolvens ATCC 35603 = DSM 2933]